MMEVGVNSPETNKVAGIAMEFPAIDGVELSSPPRVPLRLRRRLSEAKASSPSSVEEIDAKLRDADLRRQKFYESLSSKARSKPRSPHQSSHEEDLGHRLEAKLQAAEQKRLSILAKAQLRLTKLDELRQAARTEVEVRAKKECAELGAKVQWRVQRAESNRMHILKASRQRRATLKERTSQSLLRRMARESKYKEWVRAAINQKRAAAEKKRLELLEADKKRAHARLLQVSKTSKSVSQQREIERRRLREGLEYKLQRAKRQRTEFLMQRARVHNAIGVNWNKKMQKQAQVLSRKLARCWRKFLKQRTTFDLAKAYNGLNINMRRVKSIPFEHLALLIESGSTLHTTKALLDRLELYYKVSLDVATISRGQDDINHLLKRVVSPNKRASPRLSFRSRDAKKSVSVREAANAAVKLSRYQVRVVLCAYMILGHPDAVFSGRGERESALAKSAEIFVKEFELLVKIILDGPVESLDEKSDPSSHRRMTFRSQLTAFDAAWCSYLNKFVVWKVKDAESLEEDLVRAACQLEFSMMQKCKRSPEGDNNYLTHDMKAIQKQVTEDQKLLREKVMHLSGDAGIERMQNALSNTRSKYFQAKENGSPVGSPVAHIYSPSSPSSPPGPSALSDLQKRRNVADGTEGPSHAVRSLFKDGASSPPLRVVGFSPHNKSNDSGETLGVENELIVNEFIHGHQHSLADSPAVIEEDKNVIKVRETIEKAFWDGVTESIKKDKPEYNRVVELMREVRDELCKMAPESWKQEITEAIDLEILSQLLNSGNLDMDYLGKVMEFSLVSLQKLSAAANENKLKEAHQKVLQELAEICLAGDGSNHSHVVALIKGLRFVLEQIKILKQEISKAHIRIMEPLLKGPAGLEYLGKAFAKRYGPPSDASTALPLTNQWLSSVWPNKDQEWSEYARSLSELTSAQESSSSQRHLPSTTLRTGGNFSVKMSTATATNAEEKQLPACKGEKVDLAVRLGLLKLVSGVSSLTPKELPETLNLNFVRLWAVQAQLQKITVIATSVLVLRQTLLIDQMIRSSEEMESIGARCVKQLSDLLDTVEDAGIEELVDTISRIAEACDNFGDSRKTESRKEVIARMLIKSIQAGDPIFTRVSRAIYAAARGVVLGGTRGRGIDLVEVALRQVGAVALTDRVVEAAKVLVVVATITERVHESWYAQLTGNM